MDIHRIANILFWGWLGGIACFLIYKIGWYCGATSTLNEMRGDMQEAMKSIEEIEKFATRVAEEHGKLIDKQRKSHWG